MQEPQISQRDLETWADFLIEHSLGGVRPGERVMIKGERIGWPLMAVLERKVIAGGAIPDVCLVPPNNDRGRVWSAAMGLHGGPEQIAAVPDWHQARYESFDSYIEVLGAEDPSLYGSLGPAQAGALVAADAPFSGIRLAKNWVITLYPTPGMAAMEGIPLDEYVDFIVRASTTDPRPLKAAEERIAQLIEAGRSVEIVTRCPDRDRDLTLTMGIATCLPRMSFGLRNFPDGEVFTSPDAGTPEGEVFVDLPVHHGGNDIQGIYLKLAAGRIVEYSARVGGAQLESIIETDAGSHRLGEVAMGMNPGLDRVLKHPLFVEKVGGTAHIAIGRSYHECYVEDPNSEAGQKRIAELKTLGVINDSAQHVDIVIDFRPGGAGRRLSIDGREMLVRDRIWVPSF
ncbi:MAG TPA: aminopeptidase [Polyangia bacterium]|nr:aminopeptidase [Polyangia bacterium]